MLMTLDKFRAKLVIKILYAGAAADSIRYVNAATRGMEKRNINGYIVLRFLYKVNNQLSLNNPAGLNPQQLQNIKAAKNTIEEHIMMQSTTESAMPALQ
jgi:hypothetical protein